MREKLLMLALVFITNSGLISAFFWTTRQPTTSPSWTTPAGAFGVNLTGKMFTLTNDGSGISLYAPDFSPNSTSWPVTPSYRTYWYRGYVTPRPYRYRGYVTPRPYRYRGYVTPRPYKYRGYVTPQPYRYRGYVTPRPYWYRGYITPRPYRYHEYVTPRPYRNHGYVTPRPYRHRTYVTPRPYWYREYVTPRPYWYRGVSTPRPYRNRGYVTPRPYNPYRNRWYNTPPPYKSYRNRWYNTPPPYNPNRSREYTTTSPDYDYWNREYNTPQPFNPSWTRSYTTTSWYPTIQPATAQPAKSVTDLPTTTFPAKTARGVSVCLRLLVDLQRRYQPTLFTLSPSTRPLTLRVYDVGTYALVYSWYSSYNINLKPDVRFWSRMQPDFWTRLCVTVDSLKSVAQLFSGADMSVRRKLYTQYVWSGEPVINIPAFDGQVTDIQVWDYPLSYGEVYNYMNKDAFWPNPGNVLTWSDISYSPGGRTLLEDVYENQMGWQIRSQRKKGRHGKGERKSWEYGKEKRKKSVNERFKWKI